MNNHREQMQPSLSRIEQVDLITYPPEMLPFPDEDEVGDVYVCLDHGIDGECLNCRILASHMPTAYVRYINV